MTTGLKDSNGREICEGDIIENIAIRDKVVFRNGVWTTEQNVSDQPLEMLMPLTIISRG